MLQAELRALAGVRAEDTVTSAAVYEPGVLRASKVLPLWHWLSVLGLLSLQIPDHIWGRIAEVKFCPGSR